MKNLGKNPTLGVLPLLGLIVVFLYSFIQSPRADNSGCGTMTCGAAGITISSSGDQNGQGMYAEAYDSCTTSYKDGSAKMLVGCGSATVTGGGDIEGYGCQTQDVFSYLEVVSPSDWQKYVDVVPIYDWTGTNIIGYTLSNATKALTITFKTDVKGSCQNTAGDCGSVEFTVTESLEIVGGGGCTSGSCSSPAPVPNQAFASASYNKDPINHLDFRLSLGMSDPRDDAGFLSLQADGATTNLSQPTLLQLPYNRPYVQVITNATAIEQINTPEGLVNVHVISLYEYHLECFYAENVGAQGTNGLFATNGPAFATYIIKNPDGASDYTNLWITEETSSGIRQFQYTNSPAKYGWDLLKPDGQVLSIWRVPTTNAWITNYYRQVTFNGQVAAFDQKTYQQYSVSAAPNLLQDIEGTGANVRTTTYSYYSSNPTNGASRNLLQEVIYPEGNWNYYVYDSLGEVVQKYSAYENSPVSGSSGPNPSGDDCLLTEYDYGDNPPNIPYQTTVSIPVQSGGVWSWQTVSCNYHDVSQPGCNVVQVEDLRTSTYLTTTTYFWTAEQLTNTTMYEDGLPQTVQNPDGTTTSYVYPDEYTTIEYDPNGTTNTTVVDSWGDVLSKTTVASGVTLARQTYTYTNAMGVYFDPLCRTYLVNDLAGRTNIFQYDCCNLESSTDPDGVQTSYAYNVLKRRVAATKYYGGTAGITTTNVLDAMGRVLMTMRIGTDGTWVTNSQLGYDVLGRVIAQTNALGGVTLTTYATVNNQLIVTNTYFPGGGIEVETNYADGRLASTTGTAVHGVAYQYGAETDPETGVWVEYTLATKLDQNNNATTECTKTYKDSAGRNYKTIYASANSSNACSRSYYNEYGQLWEQVDPDGVTNFMVYGNNGDLDQSQVQYTITALSATALGIQDYNTLTSDLSSLLEAGADRIQRTARSVYAANLSSGQPALLRTDTYAWTNNESDTTGTLIRSSEASVDGLQNWNIQFANAAGSLAVTNQSHTGYTAPNRYETNRAPDGSYTVSSYGYGILGSTIHYDAGSTQILATAYINDAHNRLAASTDARNGTTTYLYNAADLATNVTSPTPPGGSGGECTFTIYDQWLRPITVVQPDKTSVTNVYLPTGELVMQYGSRTYPVGYGYDYAGRMQHMTNWSGFSLSGSSGSRVTTWNYDGYRGFLASKTYAGSTAGPAYTYTAAGRLASRSWARGATNAYNYDQAGELRTVVYSDSTPAVTNVYDGLGRVVAVACNGMTDSRSYDLAGDLLCESFAGGALGGLAVSNQYDGYLRRTNVAVLGASAALKAGYTYDAASRLKTVNDGVNDVATYSYLANSSLVGQTCPVRHRVASERRDCLFLWIGNRRQVLGSFVSRGKPSKAAPRA